MPQRAQLTAFETIRIESRGIPTSIGILTLRMPDGRIHQFSIISGGFGRGAAPGMHEDLNSADGWRYGRQDMRAIYPIVASNRSSGNPDMRAGGADFFIRLASPPDAHRGRSLGEVWRPGALGIHPDGDSHDMRRPLGGGPREQHDGLPDDGTNGCFGLSSADAKRFQDVYFGLPANQRPTSLYVIAPPARGPVAMSMDMAKAVSAFKNLGR